MANQKINWLQSGGIYKPRPATNLSPEEKLKAYYKAQADKGRQAARISNNTAKKLFTGIATPFLATAGLVGAVTAPLAMAGGIAGDYLGNKATEKVSSGKYNSWGQMVSNKTGMSEEVAAFTNPGAWIGGGIGSIAYKPGVTPVVANPIQKLSIPESGLRSGNDLVTAAQIAKKNMVDYINHPVIQETAARNKALSERIGLRTPKDVTVKDGKFEQRDFSITDYRNKFINQPVDVQFGNLGDDVLANYSMLGPNGRSMIQANWKNYSNKSINDAELIGSLEHEFGHHAKIGISKIEDLKGEKLLRPYSELKNPYNNSIMSKSYEGEEPYLTMPGEASMNIMDLGKDLGLKIGQPYEGSKKLMQMLNKYSYDKGEKSFVINDLRLNTPRDYKRVWDALTGKYFTIPTIGIVGASQVQTKKEGGKINWLKLGDKLKWMK